VAGASRLGRCRSEQAWGWGGRDALAPPRPLRGGHDFDGPAAAIDETQVREAEIVERDKEWIDWRERVGGEE
jgi:hypothetical protein